MVENILREFIGDTSFLQLAENINSEAKIVQKFKVFLKGKEAAKVQSLFKEEMSKGNFLHLKRLEINHFSEKELKITLLFLSTIIGTPTSHTYDEDNYVWSIFNDIHGGANFSKTMSAIPLHTDSQFKDNPEQFFLLYCLSSSKEDDGYTTILDYRYVIDRILQLPDGNGLLKHLLTTEYPSLVPDIFSTTEKVTYNTILTNSSIRFRKDTIEKAMELIGEKNENKIHALETLSQALSSNRNLTKIKLQKSDLLIQCH